ncbi:serine/threonine protein kinase [Marinimicrobium sp. C6131]|uniref:serine/threonine-protein kinase n=1 Tax=Marinimicrobium sp. C6131 TaxID=3022676 RepID=UPI00223CE8C4|nr:serine/threonine-protein kinase [Marinimicrobium sp. C6131]UZJ45141.1 serine/threonine protein kinase [Marinimicrobium sp. C6131]
MTERLADGLSLRVLVLLLGGWLILFPQSLPSPSWLDAIVFDASLALTPERVRYTHSVSPPSADRWYLIWPEVTDRWAEQGLSGQSGALLNGGYRTPWWFYPAFSGLILALVVYLLWLTPAMGRVTALLMTGLLTVGLVAGQIGAQISQGLYLPLGLAVQYLWIGLLLIGAYWHQCRWYRQAQYLRRQLGIERFENGHWKEALTALKACPTSDSILDLLYDQGREHERRQRRQEALACYREIAGRKPMYRDVPRRLEVLETRPGSAAGASTLAQTQVLEEFAVPQQLGRYQIERELGRGAMGIVYLGRDPHIAREVAIKTLNVAPFDADERENLKKRFFREAEAAGRLRHPNIVTVYDVGQEHELAFIAMDYVRGEPLNERTAQSRQLPLAKVYELMATVAEALAYAHEQQVVHRDIKPGNILYDPEENRVVVTDFGIARVANSARTQTGEIMGSPLYMSPEQLRGARVGPASDIFSLGVTLYQLLTGALPFRGDTIAELSYQIVQSRHKPLREVRKDLPRSATRIVNKALQKEPEKRYANAAEMARALRTALEKEF